MSHLWDRLAEAKSRLAPVQSKYRVLFEDPSQPDAPAAVLVPDPNWMAAALAGGILPPIETYLRDRDVPDGQPKEHPYAEPIGAMTEEQAIEYLIQKDISPAVWRDYAGNRCILRIVPVELIPSDRSFRNAWRVCQQTQRRWPHDHLHQHQRRRPRRGLADCSRRPHLPGRLGFNGAAVEIDMTAARGIHRDNLRAERAPKLSALDVDYMKALEEGDTAAQQAIVSVKQALRDVTGDARIEAAATADALKALTLDVLTA
jgi:hypothetical protein